MSLSFLWVTFNQLASSDFCWWNDCVQKLMHFFSAQHLNLRFRSDDGRLIGNSKSDKWWGGTLDIFCMQIIRYWIPKLVRSNICYKWWSISPGRESICQNSSRLCRVSCGKRKQPLGRVSASIIALLHYFGWENTELERPEKKLKANKKGQIW